MTKKVDEYVATHSVIRRFYVVVVLSVDMDMCLFLYGLAGLGMCFVNFW